MQNVNFDLSDGGLQERPLTPFNILKVAVSVAVAYLQGAHSQSLIAKRQLSAAQRPSFRRK
jgi:hypothetical protein